MMDIRAEKSALRRDYLERRLQIPDDVRAETDAAVCRALLSSAAFRLSDTVLAYAPKAPEVDILPAILSALNLQKKVAFPRCETGNRLSFHFAAPSDLRRGAFGILEPDATMPLCTSFSNTVCLVPALLFDRSGYRLGYGKGYYDRFLADFEGTTIGIAREDFILPALPRGAYDRSVHILISEKGVLPIS